MYFAKYNIESDCMISSEPLAVYHARDKSYIPIWIDEQVIGISKVQAIEYSVKFPVHCHIIEC